MANIPTSTAVRSMAANILALESAIVSVCTKMGGSWQ
jgi:hypothetical protein